MRKRTTKGEKLLRAIKKSGDKGLTHKEIVKFLLRGTGQVYNESTRKTYDSYLYGTSTRTGVLSRCDRDWSTGRYTLPSYVGTERPLTEKVVSSFGNF